MADITLYHNDMSVCSAKVRMALAEKDVTWTGVHLDLRAGDTQKPDYAALNPNRLVPTLVRDGRVLIESNIICEYIDDAWPTPPLRPADAYDRARMRLWMKLLDDWVHGATGTISLCIAFRHQFLRRGEAAIEAYMSGLVDPQRRERLKLALAQGMDAPAFAPAIRRLARLLADLDATLAEHPYLAGQDFSLADLAYAPYMIRFMAIGFADDIRARPRLAQWAERLFERPSYRAGVAEWLNPGAVEIMREQHDAARARIRGILAG
ncbi:MAG TPA: glutathione S-transferase family protein [Stellaceae bacterium]|nr:glutathione S-transferase family protein [Stellaceae bacterium]